MLALADLGLRDVPRTERHLRKAVESRAERDFAMQFRFKHNLFKDPLLEAPPLAAVCRQLGVPELGVRD